MKDPFSLQSFSVLSETVPVTLQEEGQGSGRQGISRSLGIEEVDRLLEEHRLVVVVGGAGAGKTLLTKQMGDERAGSTQVRAASAEIHREIVPGAFARCSAHPACARVQVRVVMGKEPLHFIRLFRGRMVILVMRTC